MTALKIGDLIAAPPVRTVVRIEEGKDRPRETCAQFVLTDEVSRHFMVLAESFGRSSGRGAFLRGDFGSGKSHFLAALLAFLSDPQSASTLADAHPGLRELARRGRRLLPVSISLVRHRSSTPLETLVVQAIESALAEHGHDAALSGGSQFLARLREILKSPELAAELAKRLGLEVVELDSWMNEHPRETLASGWGFLAAKGFAAPELMVQGRAEIFEAALDAVASAGFDGLVLLIDELSEYLLSKPNSAAQNEDARTLQLLGEIATSRPLWIICAVQESVEKTGDIAAPTLRKIKDRFPIVLALSTLHVRELLARRLVRHLPGADEHLLVLHRRLTRAFPGFRTSFDRFRDIYPVHPTTLALLEGLSDLFSQHRGVVDFVHARIAGDPERGIAGILDRPAEELLAPDAIYEHFAPRIAEFSDLHVLPRHVVPALDELIATTLIDGKDCELARRLVRILVLFSIHPTATNPDAMELAELTACMLSQTDPQLAAAFVAEAILDPLAAQSPFLVKRLEGGRTTYGISTEHDHHRTLQARLTQARSGIGPDDSRLVLTPLSELSVSPVWPLSVAALTDRTRAPVMTMTWRNSQRQALVLFAQVGEEIEVAATIEKAFAAGVADFAVVLTMGNAPIASPHTATWLIPAPTGDAARVLIDAQAARQLSSALVPGNPADAPLIALVEEALVRLRPEVERALLALIYQGHFHGGAIAVEPAALQLKRFHRLIDAAGEHLLEARFPEWKRIAPARTAPSARLYFRLFDELVRPGSISLTVAAQKGLSEPIESLVEPLGLVELRTGSYRLAPDPSKHPLLGYLFAQLASAATTPIAQFRQELARGRFGVPADTIDFLLAALAHAGALSLSSKGRRLAIEFLNPAGMGGVDAIAPGERISPTDQATLLSECEAILGKGEWGSFGLRQQRDAWTAVQRFRDRAIELANALRKVTAAAKRYSALSTIPWEHLLEESDALDALASSVKVSLPAREGLERFLAAWRGGRHDQERFERLVRARVFLEKNSERLVLIAHYLRHPVIERETAEDPELAVLVEAVAHILADPLKRALPDEGAALVDAFEALRVAHATRYAAAHTRYQQSLVKPVLGRETERVREVLSRLAGIESLDQPPGLSALLGWIDRGSGSPCRRDLQEELLRSPACDCGYLPWQESPMPPVSDPGAALAGAMSSYQDLLSSPDVVAAISARAFARDHIDPQACAALRTLLECLQSGGQSGSQNGGKGKSGVTAILIERLDQATVREIERALGGNAVVLRRSLADLHARLDGRRLTAERVIEQVHEWIGDATTEAVLALDGSSGISGAAGATVARSPHSMAACAWWPRLHGALLSNLASAAGSDTNAARDLGLALAAAYPESVLRPHLARATDEELAAFIVDEPLHGRAIALAWALLSVRVLAQPAVAARLPMTSRALDPPLRTAIDNRMELLVEIAHRATGSFPDRMRMRIACAAIHDDSWANQDVKKAAVNAIATLSRSASEWLETLPPVPVIDPASPTTVLLIDGLAADVALVVADALHLHERFRITWHALAVAPETRASIAALFGAHDDRDPTDALAERGVPYHSLDGGEASSLLDLVPTPPADRACLLRIALLDRLAHTGGAGLSQMPELLQHVLARHLEALIEDCARRNRHLIITTDHGLSLSPSGLTHGKGGPFERAIFRAEL